MWTRSYEGQMDPNCCKNSDGRFFNANILLRLIKQENILRAQGNKRSKFDRVTRHHLRVIVIKNLKGIIMDDLLKALTTQQGML